MGGGVMVSGGFTIKSADLHEFLHMSAIEHVKIGPIRCGGQVCRGRAAACVAANGGLCRS